MDPWEKRATARETDRQRHRCRELRQAGWGASTAMDLVRRESQQRAMELAVRGASRRPERMGSAAARLPFRERALAARRVITDSRRRFQADSARTFPGWFPPGRVPSRVPTRNRAARPRTRK